MQKPHAITIISAMDKESRPFDRITMMPDCCRIALDKSLNSPHYRLPAVQKTVELDPMLPSMWRCGFHWRSTTGP